MLVLRDPILSAGISNKEIRSLVDRRFEMLSADAPYNSKVHGFFVVLEESDDLSELDRCLGFSIFTNRMNQTRFGNLDFTPSFELLEEHRRYYEMVFVLRTCLRSPVIQRNYRDERKEIRQRYQSREICRVRAAAVQRAPVHEAHDSGPIRGVLCGAVCAAHGLSVALFAQ